MNLPIEALLGPIGGLVLALYVLNALWVAHKESDADVRAQRDLATAGWREQTTATNRLADAIEHDGHDRAERHRAGDRR